MTISQFALSSALKSVGKPIALCPTPEMYRLFEDSIRGGISFCNTHHVEASNPHVNPGTLPSDDDVSLMYIDMNNLYGSALSKKLPIADFEQYPNAENIDCKNVETEGSYGWLLKVDLEYPQEIQDRTAHFPLAAENFVITDAMLTPEMHNQYKMLNMARGRKEDAKMKDCVKLVGTCLPKIGYCIHFKQAEIYKPFIDMNTKLRSEAKNLFDKNFYKQKNCSLFGKSMENVRDRLKVKLVGEPYTYIHHASKPTFSCAHVLAPDLSITVFTNDNVKLKSTIAIGAAVFDLSKLEMYELAYEKLPMYEQ